MSDAKKASGFLASDGSFHPTKKAALEHSANIKLREQVSKFASNALALLDGEDLNHAADLSDWLLNYRESILDALTVKVSTRGPYKRRPKSAEGAAA